MQHLRFSQLLFVLGSLSCVSCARILAVLPLAARSHHNFHKGVLQALALRGHEVVVYGPFPRTTPIPNYTDIYLQSSYNDDFLTYDMMMDIVNNQALLGMDALWVAMNIFIEDTLKSDEIQNLAKSQEKFDLVIVEAFMAQESLLIFGHIFNAPTIVFQPFGTFSLVNEVMGNALSIPSIPEFNFPFTNVMNLVERLKNSFGVYMTLFNFYTKQIPFQQRALDLHLNIPGAPSLEEMIKNISLVYTNAHQLISYPQPLTPNIIPLGGIHLTKERKPIPEEMKKFLDEAENGVIYFSLGTCVPDHRMPGHFYQQFVRVFKTLQQRVLWKTRRENIPNLPKNVMLTKWAPQEDLLAHPNIVLFITHGGLLSLLELTQAGVPVIGVPFFADQPMDVKFYVARGVGVQLDFATLSEETISTAINTVLNNPKYKENAVKLAKIFNHLPMSQQELAVHWTEHVLMHGDAHHLKPPSAHILTWYQKIMIDIMLIVMVAILAALLVIYFVCKRVLRWLKKPSKSQKLD